MFLTFLDFGAIRARRARARGRVFMMLLFEGLRESTGYAAWPPVSHEPSTVSWANFKGTHTRDVPHVPLSSCHSKLGSHRHHCVRVSTPRLHCGWEMDRLDHCLMLALRSLTVLPKQTGTYATGGLTYAPRGPRSSLTPPRPQVEAGCRSRSRRRKLP